jgi:hypothetical protein
MSKFKRPEEYAVKEPRTPVSTRIKMESREALEKAAKKAGLTLSELIGNVIDDYAKFLKEG